MGFNLNVLIGQKQLSISTNSLEIKELSMCKNILKSSENIYGTLQILQEILECHFGVVL